MARTLRWLALAMGLACALIGVVHLLFGVASVPGEAAAGATVDSRERYYGAVFLGYGLAWVWAARQRPVPATAVRWLAGVFLLGAVGRLISLVLAGPPQVFQVVLTVIEVALAPVFFWLSRGRKSGSHRPSGVAGSMKKSVVADVVGVVASMPWMSSSSGSTPGAT